MLGTLTLRSVWFSYLVSAIASSRLSVHGSFLRCWMVKQLRKSSSKGSSCITIKSRRADSSSFSFVVVRSENERAGRKNANEENTKKAYEGIHKGYLSDRKALCLCTEVI